MTDENLKTKAARALLATQRHTWEQGMAMQAFYEMGEMETVIPLAKEAVYRQLPDGRAATIGVFDGATDPCAVGQGLQAAANATGDEELQAGLQRLLQWALQGAPRSSEGAVYHLTTGREFWVDSLYMLPPFLAAAGHPGEALGQFNVYWDRLYDPAARLMHHKWDEGKRCFTRAAHWGVGNGWALAATARMIRLLPDEYEGEKTALARQGEELLQGVLAQMRRDGLFHDVVDDPETFVETNLSQQVAYTLYRGMQDGWLGTEHEAAAHKLRSAARAKVDRYGFVQGVCAAPEFDRPGTSPEGQAFFLLMEQAAEDYEKHSS